MHVIGSDDMQLIWFIYDVQYFSSERIMSAKSMNFLLLSNIEIFLSFILGSRLEKYEWTYLKFDVRTWPEMRSRYRWSKLVLDKWPTNSWTARTRIPFCACDSRKSQFLETRGCSCVHILPSTAWPNRVRPSNLLKVSASVSYIPSCMPCLSPINLGARWPKLQVRTLNKKN